MKILLVCGLLGGCCLQRDPYLLCINNPYKPQTQIKKAATLFSVNSGYSLLESCFELSNLPKYLYVFCYIKPCKHTSQSPSQRLRVSFKASLCSVRLVQTISAELSYTNCGVRGHHLQSPCNTRPQLPSMASHHGFARYLRVAEKVGPIFFFFKESETI